MRSVLNQTTPEVIKNCPRCGGTETMFKATVRLCVRPLLTAKGFICAHCNLFIVVTGWADDIEEENVIRTWNFVAVDGQLHERVCSLDPVIVRKPDPGDPENYYVDEPA